MNLYPKTTFIVLSAFLLFAARTQAQHTATIEKDSILQQFATRIEEHPDTDSSEIIQIIKLYEGWEITSRDTEYERHDSVFRQYMIREDLVREMSSILNDHKHPKSASMTRTPRQGWTHIMRILAWAAALMVLLVVIQLVKAKMKSRNVVADLPAPDNGNPDIVLRRKTTSILRKQSLEDVIGNDNYMKIDCEEFCDNSAVRRMYIKNTCIKEIYKMYADNLRNPDKPNEFGCMVLGRWVYDHEADEYYVSLEQTLLPGDDAIFAEYELNFGGKIQMKKRQILNKLRQETNLQYDLTCWVHSHPGIGVFFSNNDNSVQMLLKNRDHPRFLTAIVIDILTPRQDLGIFTFKQDYTINSKDDLRKMYSLEEWYKWAVESGRNSYRPEDHYDTLSAAKGHVEGCNGIALSNGAIIDMGLMAAEQREGFVATVQGFAIAMDGKKEFVASRVTASETTPDNEPVGCFVIASHCSIPSVRKVLADRLGRTGFVLVYTTGDGLLTSIPVINNDLCADQNFYGEQQLEELKIWTRRKR